MIQESALATSSATAFETACIAQLVKLGLLRHRLAPKDRNDLLGQACFKLGAPPCHIPIPESLSVYRALFLNVLFRTSRHFYGAIELCSNPPSAATRTPRRGTPSLRRAFNFFLFKIGLTIVFGVKREIK